MKILEKTGKGWLFSLLFSALLAGCAGQAAQPQLPPLSSLHPVGYPRLVGIVPECKDPGPDNRSACLLAARMLETSTTSLSTRWFIFHWASVSFSAAANKTDREATERVAVPVLKYLYRHSQDDYSQAMRAKAEEIHLDSMASFEDFRDAHVDTLNAAQAP